MPESLDSRLMPGNASISNWRAYPDLETQRLVHAKGASFPRIDYWGPVGWEGSITASSFVGGRADISGLNTTLYWGYSKRTELIWNPDKALEVKGFMSSGYAETTYWPWFVALTTASIGPSYEPDSVYRSRDCYKRRTRSCRFGKSGSLKAAALKIVVTIHRLTGADKYQVMDVLQELSAMAALTGIGGQAGDSL